MDLTRTGLTIRREIRTDLRLIVFHQELSDLACGRIAFFGRGKQSVQNPFRLKRNHWHRGMPREATLVSRRQGDWEQRLAVETEGPVRVVGVLRYVFGPWFGVPDAEPLQHFPESLVVFLDCPPTSFRWSSHDDQTRIRPQRTRYLEILLQCWPDQSDVSRFRRVVGFQEDVTVVTASVSHCGINAGECLRSSFFPKDLGLELLIS